MKKILTSLVLLGASVARADDLQHLSGEKILYTAKHPAALRRVLPRGAKFYFCGSFRLAKGQPLLWMQLLNPAPVKATDNSDLRIEQLQLQIFQLSRRGRHERAHLINSVRFTYRGPEPRQFAAQLLWLDAQKKQPIIKLDCWNAGRMGPIGDQILCVFAGGVTHRAVVQRIFFGLYSGLDGGGSSYTDFSNRDEKGQLLLESTVVTGVVSDPYRYFSYKWNGQRFALEVVQKLNEEQSARVVAPKDNWAPSGSVSDPLKQF